MPLIMHSKENVFLTNKNARLSINTLLPAQSSVILQKKAHTNNLFEATAVFTTTLNMKCKSPKTNYKTVKELYKLERFHQYDWVSNGSQHKTDNILSKLYNYLHCSFYLAKTQNPPKFKAME